MNLISVLLAVFIFTGFSSSFCSTTEQDVQNGSKDQTGNIPDTISSSINNISLIGKGNAAFSFLSVGHIYGYPNSSVFPCPSITSNIDMMNSSGADFMMLLGDSYRYTDSLNVNTFKKQFLNKMNIPVFNALGNHELSPSYKRRDERDYSFYRRTFGESYFSFNYCNNLMIVLDSELDTANILGDQLSFLQKQLELGKDEIFNVFIFSHQDIWRKPKSNFKSAIQPLLKKLGEKGVKTYWISGDLGGSLTNLYYFEPDSAITYIHCHVSNVRRDLLLKFNVSKNGDVVFFPISLTGNPVKDITKYRLHPARLDSGK